MNGFNKVIIAGNLTRDIELRYTNSGTAVCDLGIAINSKRKGRDKEPIEETVFVDCTVWDRQAENCSEYLSKGDPVLIEGRLTLDQWEKDGNKYSKLKVTAINVQFLSTRSDRQRGGNSGSRQQEETRHNNEEIPF